MVVVGSRVFRFFIFIESLKVDGSFVGVIYLGGGRGVVEEIRRELGGWFWSFGFLFAVVRFFRFEIRFFRYCG